MEINSLFLSCDWGTSSFRLRLVEGSTLRILAEENNSNGIASVNELWNQSGREETQRLRFYQSFIKESIAKLEKQLEESLTGILLILSGMASSTIGMMELPYKELPFYVDGTDLVRQFINRSENFPFPMLMVSGVRSENDVMRGEEVQLIGCFTEEAEEQVFILPGTHSKHIIVQHEKAVAFQTYMTGELFHLLSTKSILAASVEKEGEWASANNKPYFEEGVKAGKALNPLHAFFLVRTNSLFKKMSKEGNFFYLSGLLIGLELKELLKQKTAKITLVSNHALSPLYTTALQVLGIADKLQVKNIDDAIIKGHRHLYKLYIENKG